MHLRLFAALNLAVTASSLCADRPCATCFSDTNSCVPCNLGAGGFRCLDEGGEASCVLGSGGELLATTGECPSCSASTCSDCVSAHDCAWRLPSLSPGLPARCVDQSESFLDEEYITHTMQCPAACRASTCDACVRLTDKDSGDHQPASDAADTSPCAWVGVCVPAALSAVLETELPVAYTIAQCTDCIPSSTIVCVGGNGDQLTLNGVPGGSLVLTEGLSYHIHSVVADGLILSAPITRSSRIGGDGGGVELEDGIHSSNNNLKERAEDTNVLSPPLATASTNFKSLLGLNVLLSNDINHMEALHPETSSLTGEVPVQAGSFVTFTPGPHTPSLVRYHTASRPDVGGKLCIQSAERPCSRFWRLVLGQSEGTGHASLTLEAYPTPWSIWPYTSDTSSPALSSARPALSGPPRPSAGLAVFWKDGLRTYRTRDGTLAMGQSISMDLAHHGSLERISIRQNSNVTVQQVVIQYSENGQAPWTTLWTANGLSQGSNEASRASRTGPAAVFEVPSVTSSIDGYLNTSLYVDEHQYVGPHVSVMTRAFNNSLPGPTLLIHPGDNMTIVLHNMLGPQRAVARSAHNTHHSPNSTNLHTHGLHVSPEQDYVFAAVDPGESKRYDYTLRADHPSGTYWYHPHHHGSSALQVGGGMAGALIVADRAESLHPSIAAMRDMVMVLTHWHLADGTEGPQKDENDITWLATLMRDDLIRAPGGVQYTRTEEALGRTEFGSFYLVNGQYQPIVYVRPGEWLRWRLINAGHFANLELEVAGCSLLVMAYDGVYLDSPRPRSNVLLPPGGRVDLAIMCEARGVYELKSEKGASTQWLASTRRYRGLLLQLIAAGSPIAMQPPSSLPPRPEYFSDLTGANVSTSFTLAFDGGMRINNRKFSSEQDRLTSVQLGNLVQWKIANSDSQSHPLHLHATHFQVVEFPADPTREGEWHDVMDTIPEGDMVIRFLPMHFPGYYVTHCHVLAHEDLGMMATVRVIEPEELQETDRDFVFAGITTGILRDRLPTAFRGVVGDPNFNLTRSDDQTAMLLTPLGDQPANDGGVFVLFRGLSYIFALNTPGHVVWMRRDPPDGSPAFARAYWTGLSANGKETGQIRFDVHLDSPDRLYLISETDLFSGIELHIQDRPGHISVVAYSSSSFHIAGPYTNPDLYMVRGVTYIFDVDSRQHPLWIKSRMIKGKFFIYNEGVENNGAEEGTLTFTVPWSAPSLLYYVCEFHDGMGGLMYVEDPVAPTASAITEAPTWMDSSAPTSRKGKGKGKGSNILPTPSPTRRGVTPPPTRSPSSTTLPPTKGKGKRNGNGDNAAGDPPSTLSPTKRNGKGKGKKAAIDSKATQTSIKESGTGNQVRTNNKGRNNQIDTTDTSAPTQSKGGKKGKGRASSPAPTSTGTRIGSDTTSTDKATVRTGSGKGTKRVPGIGEEDGNGGGNVAVDLATEGEAGSSSQSQDEPLAPRSAIDKSERDPVNQGVVVDDNNNENSSAAEGAPGGQEEETDASTQTSDSSSSSGQGMAGLPTKKGRPGGGAGVVGDRRQGRIVRTRGPVTPRADLSVTHATTTDLSLAPDTGLRVVPIALAANGRVTSNPAQPPPYSATPPELQDASMAQPNPLRRNADTGLRVVPIALVANGRETSSPAQPPPYSATPELQDASMTQPNPLRNAGWGGPDPCASNDPCKVAVSASNRCLRSLASPSLYRCECNSAGWVATHAERFCQEATPVAVAAVSSPAFAPPLSASNTGASIDFLTSSSSSFPSTSIQILLPIPLPNVQPDSLHISQPIIQPAPPEPQSWPQSSTKASPPSPPTRVTDQEGSLGGGAGAGSPSPPLQSGGGSTAGAWQRNGQAAARQRSISNAQANRAGRTRQQTARPAQQTGLGNGANVNTRARRFGARRG